MDMLRLDRRNANVCPLIPALMLRLNKDQECYNFVEWWSEMGISVEEIELPCLDVKNANVFESVDWLCASWEWNHLRHLVAITLLKIKLLLI